MNSNELELAAEKTSLLLEDWGRLGNLKIVHDVFEEAYNKGIVNALDKLKSMFKQIQLFTIIGAVREANLTILESLEKHRFDVAEALTRVAIEHSINAMYILSDQTNERAKSFLKQHLDGAQARAKK